MKNILVLICIFITFLPGIAFGFADSNLPEEPDIAGVSVIEPNEPDEPNEAAALKNIPADPNDPNNLPSPKSELLPGQEDIKAGRAVNIILGNTSELPGLKYRLLPAVFNMKGGDAAELYFKAVEVLPENLSFKILDDWLAMPASELNTSVIDAFLDNVTDSLRFADEAAHCSRCNWKKQKLSDETIKLHKGLKKLTQVIALEARSEIAKADFAGAVVTIRTGLAMARNIADCDTMLQGVLGASSASIMLEQVEAFVQADNSPSLFRPLQDLPRPLINLDKVMKQEIRDLKPKIEQYTDELFFPIGKPLNSNLTEFQMSINPELVQKAEVPGYSRSPVESLTRRLDRFVAALQCLEGIRYYQAVYGRLPDGLDDIAEFNLPDDPVTDMPFIYQCAGGRAVLMSPVRVKQTQEKRTVRYFIKSNFKD